MMRLWWTVGVLRRDFGRQAAAMPSITVDPPSSLIDEPVSIAVSGLAPSSRISIRSTLQERDKRFEAAAHFIADQHGRVNLCEQGSVGGSFVGKINLAVKTQLEKLYLQLPPNISDLSVTEITSEIDSQRMNAADLID